WAASSCQDEPETQLTAWGEGDTGAHYGCASMWLTYFYERYGLKALQTVSLDPEPAMIAFQHELESMDEPGVNEFFADWVLANWWRDLSLGDGRYGYKLMSDLNDPARRSFNSYPADREDDANQYSTDYFVLRDLPDAGTLTVNFDAPSTVQLISTDAASGSWMWYSNRRDDSTTTLTHAFDLTSVSSATLEYNVWYDTEDQWDYGYVMVSIDNGTTWTILNTPDMTDENPHGTGYGKGYTGESDGWQRESIALDDYVGQQILVRFSMITDDASNLPGMAIDDIAVPELSYASDFETDDGGWESAGWIRIDNVLPQQVWVQVSQKSDGGSDFKVSRWLYPDDQAMQVELLADAEEVVLSISPFAVVTTVPMPYRFSLSAD
ncbi:MAG TPA: hypothetical protein VHL11_23980, partial [Phototrophicaceae bacterium]|nr:hypothetical protein [Phototrophicaceae bacterium]